MGGIATGVLSGTVLSQTGTWINLWTQHRTLVKLHPRDGKVIRLNNQDLLGTRIRPSDDENGFRVQVRKRKKTTWHDGDEGRRFAGAILPRINAAGGRKDTVQVAVDKIESSGHPERFLVDIAGRNAYQDKKGVPGYINKMPKTTKLALEMALHEEQERRALEGELWLLERAWEEAEEVAEISDNLLLPEGADEFLHRHRSDRAEPPDADSSTRG